MFRPDWTPGIAVENSYVTNIDFALTAAEQRYGLASRPIKSMSVTFQAGGRTNDGPLQTGQHSPEQEVGALRNMAQRYSMAKSLWPLFSDVTFTTGEWAVATDIIPVDTTNKRFSVGDRVVFVPAASTSFGDGPFYPKMKNVVIATVLAVNANDIQVDTVSGLSWPAGARVYPLFEAQLKFSLQGNVITDSFVTLSIEAVEEPGQNQLPGLETVGNNPSGFDVHDGLPVLDPSYDFGGNIRWGFERRGQRSSAGISGKAVAYGSRGMYVSKFPVKFSDRSSAFDMIRFFDSRGGKLHPFWFVPPTTDYYDFGGSFSGNTQIIFRTMFSSDLDFDFNPYVFIKKHDGTLYIREITTGFFAGEDLALATLDTALPETLAPGDVERVGIAYKARFDSDAMTERWVTDEIMETQFSVRELEEEKSITIADISEIVTSDLLVEAAQGSCSGETTRLLIPCIACGTQMTICDDSLAPGVVEAPVTEWAALTSYDKGDHVHVVGGDPGAYECYKALNAGTSGASEPTWPDPEDCGTTVFDNDIEWEVTSCCYTVTTAPVTCEWPTQAFSPVGSCGDCAPSFPCPPEPLCCLFSIGSFTQFTAECFCLDRGFGVDPCCSCEQGGDAGCIIVEGQVIDCGIEGTYTITSAGGSCTSSCCDGGPHQCCLLRMTRTG